LGKIQRAGGIYKVEGVPNKGCSKQFDEAYAERGGLIPA